MQKLPCEASLKLKYRLVFPSCSDVLLNDSRGLGRRLSCVGRSRISLLMMLHGTVLHKLLAQLSLKPLAWNCRAKVV